MDTMLDRRVRSIDERVCQLESEEAELLASVERLRRKLRVARDEQRAVHAMVKAQAEADREAEQEAERFGYGPRARPEDYRRAVQRLGTFTVSELAAELGVTPITARKHLDALADAGIVRMSGRLGRAPMYVHVKPESPGEAFLAQQRLRTVESPEVVTARTYSGPGAGHGAQPWDAISDKPVRKVVREACKAGWSLQRRGTNHFALSKGKASVAVWCSAKNPEQSAKRIAHAVGQYDRNRVAA